MGSFNSFITQTQSYENNGRQSYKNYVAQHFKDKFGYIPEFTKIESLNKQEFSYYLEIISNLPSCNQLISGYNKEITNYSKDSELNISNDSSKSIQNVKNSSHDNNSHPDNIRKPSPSDYVRNNISNTYSKDDYTDKLLQNQDIMNKVVENSEQKLYVDSDNTENKMFNDKSNSIDIGKSFNFKPNIHFDHNEPSKKIASAYGWSYMPPQTWSVPQKRPPVCIPDNDKQSTVKAIYDKGTPVDALDWAKSGVPPPNSETKERTTRK
jgi:hypothetical protein